MLLKIKEEHSRMHLSDDHSVEVSYSGPSGFGIRGEAVGCRPKFEELGITAQYCNKVFDLAHSLEFHLSGETSDVAEEDTTNEAVLKDLVGIIGRFHLAAKHPE